MNDDTTPTLATCNGSVCSTLHCAEGWKCGPNSTDLISGLFFKLPGDGIFAAISGYIMPVVVLVTVVLNILVCVILMKPALRSPTNMILVLMAVCDTLTGLLPVPAFMYYFTGSRVGSPVHYSLCQIVDLTYRALPTMFHTASIWITLLLALQRYVYVCHSFQARQWCTIANVIKASAVILFLSILVHSSLLIDKVYTPMTVRFPPRSSELVLGCSATFPSYLQDEAVQKWFYNFYFHFRVIFIHVLPCVALVILNALLLRTMREAKKRRKQLLQQNKKSECRKLQESNSTTLMMVAVVGVFLIVEFPSAIIFALFAITLTWEAAAKQVDHNIVNLLSQVFNFCIIISYPVNFFIYARMSRQFRDAFRQLFKKSPVPLDREHSHYSTLPNENGTRAGHTNETAI